MRRGFLRALLASLLVLMVAPTFAPAGSGVAAAAGPASDFTLRDVDGNAVTLSSLKGKVVLLSFWATWCGPCKEEMPHLQQLYTEFKDKGFVVLSISSDDARTASRVKPFILSKGFTFPVLLDKDSSVTGVYNPNKTLPWTVLIDRSFQVSEVHAGFNPGDAEKLRATVLKLLGP